MIERVHVIGATGRSGQALCHALLSDGSTVVPVVRSPGKWLATGLAGMPRQADLGSHEALQAALQDAERVVSCAHARHTPAIIAAAPSSATLILLGSTRKFTRWPDAHGNGVLTGEATFLNSGRTGVMLHPTMIYGVQGEDNVQRLAALLRRVPVLPLPAGGRFLVQPIYQGDVTQSIKAALARRWDGPNTLVIAGPQPVHYATFVQAVAHAAGLGKRFILPFPAAPLILAARMSNRLPGLPTIRPDEIRRLVEDKAFDTRPMRDLLGLKPVSLAEGLALTFARLQESA